MLLARGTGNDDFHRSRLRGKSVVAISVKGLIFTCFGNTGGQGTIDRHIEVTYTGFRICASLPVYHYRIFSLYHGHLIRNRRKATVKDIVGG